MTGHRAYIGLCAAIALAASGCGGGTRQDAAEPAAVYRVAVVRATFPARQKLAEPSEMAIAIKNTGRRALPDVAVTVDSFSRRSQQAGLADPERPIWIVDEAPRGAQTAYVNTWALDRLRPGETRTFRWRVTAVQPGRHQLKWTVAAGLNGRARARTSSGDSPVTGTFAVDIAETPATAHIDPATGAVVRDDAGSSGS